MIATTLKVLSPVRHLQRLMLKCRFYTVLKSSVFAWKHAKHIEVDTYLDDDGYKVYDLRGPLFFGSVSHFRELFDPKSDPEHVVIEFRRSRVSDHSGIEALDNLAAKYKAEGKNLHIRHLSPECRQLLKEAGNLCEVNVMEDPNYHVATDKLGG